jgi:hypothetical protein
MRILIAATAALLATSVSVARADDAGLWRAYNSHEGERTRALDAFLKAGDRFASHPSVRRAKAVIAADGRMIRVLRKMIAELAGENASSDSGATAKRLALKGLREWRDMHVYMTRTMRAYIHRNRAAAKKWSRREARAGKQSGRHLKAAEAAFEKAGYSYPSGSQKRVAAHR